MGMHLGKDSGPKLILGTSISAEIDGLSNEGTNRNKMKANLDTEDVFESEKYEISIREARLEDLPSVHQLIRDSFKAMYNHSYLPHSIWDNAASNMIDNELSSGQFIGTYFNKKDYPDNCFWVAERIGKTQPPLVLGCVGFKRKAETSKDGELVRMAVDLNHRQQGVGSLLIQHLFEYSQSKCQGVDAIVLTTGNPDAAKFYKKHGFNLYNRFLFFYGVKQMCS